MPGEEREDYPNLGVGGAKFPDLQLFVLKMEEKVLCIPQVSVNSIML